MKKYVLISDFSLTSRNRGTAALGYGSISFLKEKGYLHDNQIIVDSIQIGINPLHKSVYSEKEVQGRKIIFFSMRTNIFEYGLWKKTGFSFPFLPWGRFVRKIACVAALNGGDGFSDIYGEELFRSRLQFIQIAMKAKVPLIIMPQTIGPFENLDIKAEAKSIMQYATQVFVRDSKYTKELEEMGIDYELTNDLSAYMQPEPWDINIKPNAVGINISGLAYSNKFLDLAGQFDAYPELITRIVQHFQKKGNTIYLIPHAYGYHNPELYNDDLLSSREFYEKLADKTNVVLIDRDLISPQVKYVISQMGFFIGTRMHANFAAIYTKVPVYGLSYSYKFEGAFNANGQDSVKQISQIRNISMKDIDEIISKIDSYYKEVIK